MGVKRVAWGILVSMTAATAGGFGVTAEAATQTQSQSQDLFTSQNQDIQTNGGITATQSASSNMTTSQTQTTSTDATSSVPKDSNKTTVESDQSQTAKGDDYSFNETQHNDITTTQGRTGDSNSAQFQSHVQATSSQSGTLTSTDNAQMTQGQATLIDNKQTQTQQFQESSAQKVTTQNYFLPAKSSFARTDVIGYAFFDQSGNRLSSAYGMYPNPDNNDTKHYALFVPFQPTTVVVKAVNAYGEPVNNPNPQPIFFRSNNGDSMFLMAHSTQIVASAILPAGSDGLQITYMNTGANAQYDILDAGYLVVSSPRPHRQDPIMIVEQTEQGTVSGTTATQSEKEILTTTQNTASDITQTQQTSANANTDETQSVTTAGGDQLNQAQNLTVTGNQDVTNHQGAANSWSTTASQSTTSTTANPVQLSQHQTVAVADSWQHINVTVQQSHGTDPDSGNLWLNQLLQVTPTTDPQVGSRTINVTVGSHNYQYVVGAGGSVVFDESQSVDTSKDNTVTGTFDIKYGSAVYHVPMNE